MRIRIAVFLLVAVSSLNAAGISIDNGLTPPLDRWIIRAQVRFLGRKSSDQPNGQEINNTVVPLVVVYGLRPNLTLLLRQTVMYRESGTVEDSGLGDLFLMAKFKVIRINIQHYTFGLAATLGLELPSGNSPFTSDTWNLNPGFFITFRHGVWSEDLSTVYSLNGFAGEADSGIEPGDRLNLDYAVSRQFALNNDFTISLAPVVELSYSKTFTSNLAGYRLPNSGESLLFISPGIKLIIGSFILEALVQTPVWQHQNGNLPERKKTVLLGTRLLF